MAAIVGQEERIVGCHMDTVRPWILPLAPGAQKIALPIEHHHRVLAAVEHVDAILAVDPDGGDLLERPPVGQFCPGGVDAVFELVASHDHWPPPLPVHPSTSSIAIPPLNASTARLEHC